MYDYLTLQTLGGIREAASRHRLNVVGHLPFKVKFEEAGINDLQHLWTLQMPEVQPGFDFNNSKDFAHYMTTWLELDNASIKDIVRISVDQDITHTPTLIVSKNLFRDASQDKAALMPRMYRDVIWSTEHGIKYIRDHSKEELVKMSDSIKKMQELTCRLFDAGVRIITGSDAPGAPVTDPGLSLQEELGLLVEAELSLEDTWAAGTRVAGECLNAPMLGTLRTGAPADFLVFRQDPTRDIKALSTLEAVGANGRLYSKEVLDDGFKCHQKHFNGWLCESVTIAAAKDAIKKMG